MKRGLSCAAAGGLVAALVAVTSGPAASITAAQTPTEGFADGRWEGVVHYRAVLSTDVVQATGGYDEAGFQLVVADGLPAGSFRGTGTVEVSLDQGSGAVAVEMLGSFAGTQIEPILRPEVININGSMSVAGQVVPVNTSIGSGQLNDVPLDIYSSNCSTVNGGFDSALATANAELGTIGTLNAPIADWSAIRVNEISDDESAIITRELLRLLVDADELVAAAEGGSFDGDGLNRLISDAEQIANRLGRNEGCGLAAEGRIASILSVSVDRLLVAMLGASDSFSTTDWGSAALSGVSTGAIGAGGSDAGQRLAIIDVLTARADGDLTRSEWTVVAFAGAALGSQGLVKAAQEGLRTQR